MANYNNTTTESKPMLCAKFTVQYPKWNADHTKCRFSLDLPELGMTLYGLTLTRTKDGKPFLAPPSFQYNTKWYSHYFVRFDPRMQEAIIAQCCQADPAVTPAQQKLPF